MSPPTSDDPSGVTPKDETLADVLASAVSVKLPAFSSVTPLSWFRRAEIQFRLKKITDPRTKADHVLEAIPEDMFPHISCWLDQQKEIITYDQLKDYLLGEFTPTASARAQQMFELSGRPLGDRTARAVWNEFQALSTLPTLDADGKPQQVDLLRELWLRTLPPTIRSSLADAEGMSMADLVSRADHLLEAHKASLRNHSINHTEDDDSTASTPTPTNAVHRRRHPATTRHPAPTTTPPTSTTTPTRTRQPHLPRGHITPSGLCYYHHRFGAAARNCISGCTWPKNS